MTKINKTDFKDLLKNEIEKKLKGHQQYFSREDLRNLVPEVHLGTFNKYLVDFGKEGILFGAGRGWYSFIKQSLSEIDEIIETAVAFANAEGGRIFIRK